MSAPTAQGSPSRNFEQFKVMFGAVLSQILYARHAFPPRSFQLVDLHPLQAMTFEDLVASGSPIGDFDEEHLRDQSSSIFLRSDHREYDLSNFLGLLTMEVFSMIEREQLIEFQLLFMQSKGRTIKSLTDCYTIVLTYETSGGYHIDVWRAGIGIQYVSKSKFELWNLGDYLSRLPPLEGSILCSIAFHSLQHPDGPKLGAWDFAPTSSDDAKRGLQQRGGYCHDRIAHLSIKPLPNAFPHEKPDPPSTLLTQPNSSTLVAQNGRAPQPLTQAPDLDFIYEIPDEPSSQPIAKGAPEKGTGKPAKAAQKRNSPIITQTSHANKSAVRSQMPTNRAAVKAGPNTTRNITSVKRKSKPPLQIREDVASNLAETQEIIRESQSQSKKATTRKRKGGSEATANSESKRLKLLTHAHSSIDLGVMEYIISSDAPLLERGSSTSSARSSFPRSANGESVKGPNESESVCTNTHSDDGNVREASQEAQAESMPGRDSLFGPNCFNESSGEGEDVEDTREATAAQVDAGMQTLLNMDGYYTSDMDVEASS